MPFLSLSKRRASAAKSYGLALLFIFTLFLAFALPHGSRAMLPPAETPEIKQKPRTPEFVPGEIIVRFRDETTAKSLQARTAAVLSAEGRQIPMTVERFDGAELLKGLRVARVAPEKTLEAIAALNQRSDVLYAEPNYRRYADAIPFDTYYGQMYALKNTGQVVLGVQGTPGVDINAETAWNITTGNRNIVVGVIDQGVDINHPDLKDNIWTNPGESGGGKETNGIDDDGDGYVDDVHGWDFIPCVQVPGPGCGNNTVFDSPSDVHGTHVSGTIGASGNNGIGVTGVNWQVTLLPLKFLGSEIGSGDGLNAIRAINLAIKLRQMWETSGGTKGANIRVLSNSWGGGGSMQAELDVIKAAGDAGILFVVAAGNGGSNIDTSPQFPASYQAPNLLSVASTTSSDTLYPSSNYGPNSVDIAAPGANILSTVPNNSYGYSTGTSMATPHVSGTAALLCAANPNLTVAQLWNLIVFNSDPVQALATRTFSGARLDAGRVLQASVESDGGAPGPITNFRIASQNERAINLAWTAPGEDGQVGTAALYWMTFTDPSTNTEITITKAHPDAAGTPQSLSFNIPYRHTSGIIKLRVFDKHGNEGVPQTLNVAVSPGVGNPYNVTKSAAQPLSTGGTGLDVNADDRYIENYSLPFSFPFYGQQYSTVTVSSNGSLYFATPPQFSNADANHSTFDLNNYKMIAGMWDDLDLNKCFRADADVYVTQPGAGRVIFRWQGIPFTYPGSCPASPETDTSKFVNFEIELQQNGTIISRYGGGNIALNPVVGISGGEPEAYVVASHTSETNPLTLLNAQTVTYTPTGAACGFSIFPNSFIVGPNAQSATVAVTGGNGCNWNAVVNNATWVTINAGPLGPGSGTLTYTVQNNTTNSPRTATLSVAGQTFTIEQAAGPAPAQPIDDVLFFVRQHYLDFLEREPDAGGYAYWSSQFTKCGTDAQCIKKRRIAISAAFFIETEFQETGFFVYRIYQGGLGRRPTFEEFIPDRRLVVPGPNLAQSKAAYADAFVQRAEFVQKYQTATSAESFVDALIATIMSATGNAVDLTSQRTALINQYNTGSNINQSRSLALQMAIEQAAFKTGVYNSAFVLMQYFGYLRRNPDEGGYLFWLNVITNKEPGNFKGMVCSFLTSAEYQRRFSQTITYTNRDCSNLQ
ncbi:MAG TPA: S8 family serine peptidase [Pyrinomonadaceae bacterium]|jgi:subtilisin family serine protease